jgi:hypothetical protein
MQKDIFVKIGDFFFKYRNYLFPALLVCLFLFKAPTNSSDAGVNLGEVKNYLSVIIVGLGLFIRAAVIGFAYIKRGGLNKQVYAEKLVVEGFLVCVVTHYMLAIC